MFILQTINSDTATRDATARALQDLGLEGAPKAANQSPPRPHSASAQDTFSSNDDALLEELRGGERTHSGHSPSKSSVSTSTSEPTIDMPKNNPLRKVVTFATDASATARAIKAATIINPTVVSTVTEGATVLRNGTGWFTQCLNWAGTKVPALASLTKWAPAVKWMGIAGKAMPFIGGALAVLDVAVDYRNASKVNGAAGILEEKLAASGLTPEQITKTQEIANKGIHQGKVEAELRQHLLAHEVQNVDELINLAKEGQKARDAAFSSANTNLACTATGAIIGGIIGSVIPGAGTLLGACIGAGVGNLVNFVGNKTGLFGAIGSFFS